MKVWAALGASCAGWLIIFAIGWIGLRIQKRRHWLPRRSTRTSGRQNARRLGPPSASIHHIEQAVRYRLKDYLELAEISLHFGKLANGELGIRINERPYRTIADIPDRIIRDAIDQALHEFIADR